MPSNKQFKKMVEKMTDAERKAMADMLEKEIKALNKSIKKMEKAVK
jgi:hypothetical protein